MARRTTPLPNLLAAAGLLLSLGACSEPECQRGEIKIGMRCVDIRRPSDGGPDIEEGETRERDAAVAQDSRAATESDSDANGRDAGAEDSGSTAASGSDATSPTCLAAVEICDGADNDCDGEIDEGVTNACGGCEEIAPDHAPKKPCDNGGEGICAKPGTWGCHAGTTVCSAPDPTPSTEECDGKDNDCDGVVDNGVMKNSCGGCDPLTHAQNEACDNGLKGECKLSGAYQCSADAESIVCSAPKQVSGVPEFCDGKDNDCDGLTDEDVSLATPSECLASACVGGAVKTTSRPKGTPCSTGQCDGAGACGFCGDGFKSSLEQCDPKVAGVGTFLCSSKCETRHIYTRCSPDDPAAQSGPSKQCDSGSLCGAERYCSPPAPSGTSESCPALDGPWRQIVFYKLFCSIACSTASDCPSVLPTCKPTPQPVPDTTGYCVP